MALWHRLEIASELGDGLGWLILIFCIAALLLARVLPLDRTRLRAAVSLFVLAMAGLTVASILPGGPHEIITQGNLTYRWICIGSIFSLIAAIVTVAGVIIFDIVLKPLGLRPPPILCDLLLAFSYITVAFVVLGHGGVPTENILTSSAIVTAVIGLSFQDTLGNILGGMAIQMERTITVGDWIKVNDSVGLVKEIRWRQTSIETRNWDTVVIPNGVLIKSSVIVLGRRAGSPRQHRQYVYFNVDYRYAPTEVIAAVNGAVGTEALPNVARDPAPHALLMEFKDSYASYAVRYWLTDLFVDEQTDSLIRCRIVFALKRQGIIVAIPAYRTFQTEEDHERKQRILSENLDKRQAALANVDLLAPLNEAERRYLAEHLHDSPFARGEAIARQGDQSPCMYVVTKGEAEVRLKVEGSSQERTLAKLGAGDFFGEMGLLTGDRRSASVLAVTDVHCLRLDKEDFFNVLQNRPLIAEGISQILAQRRLELDAARDHLTGEAVKERMRGAQTDLLARIRKFFTMER
jgi:small-conductance mechanosensitive channel/CRP-like cAMP-binding protein